MPKEKIALEILIEDTKKTLKTLENVNNLSVSQLIEYCSQIRMLSGLLDKKLNELGIVT